MSANDPARLPPARRTLLTAALAGIAAGSASYGVQSAAWVPDPVFALIEAERRAEDAFSDAIGRADQLEMGETASEAEIAEAYRLQELANDEQQVAISAAFAATPTTAAGLLAMVDLFDEREMMNVSSPVDEFLAGLFAAVRSFVGGRA